jgi:hypothetical protein
VAKIVEAEKQEQNVKSSRRKFTFGGRSKNAKRPRPVKQIERERGRELAGLRKLGRMLRGMGNTPVAPSRRRVLDAGATVSIKNYDFISYFSRVGLYF